MSRNENTERENLFSFSGSLIVSIRILVVDDNVDIINNVCEYLSLKGWTIEWCTTGPDALRRLQADPFDLLILDLGLPGFDGLTICRELRAAHSKLPILMLTGRDAIDDRVRGFEAGTDDYLVKPFSLRELAARVEALLRRSYGVSEKVLRVADLEMNERPAHSPSFRRKGGVKQAARERTTQYSTENYSRLKNVRYFIIHSGSIDFDA